MDNQDQEKQSAVLNQIFPEGKSLGLTFAASKETFPETRRNFVAVLASHPELKGRLVKEFWYAGEKITRSMKLIVRDVGNFIMFVQQNRWPTRKQISCNILREAAAQPVLNCG